MHTGFVLLLLCALPAAAPASAQLLQPDTLTRDSARGEVFRLDALLVRGERSYSAASSRTIRSLDVQIRPRGSSQEILRLVPGLVIAQHAGGGKADQIFLRGFDADHGTDVAISVDGTPVNMVSHAHGQGYADLHFLIPEVVERVEVNKGPYAPSDGDFATAGSVTLRTREHLADSRVEARFGSFGSRRGLIMLPFGHAATAGGYLAASAEASDGPYEAPQHFRRYNFFGRWSRPLGGGRLVGTVSGFAADWNASGQIPDRAVRSGSISRFGAIDPTEGGRTYRHEASLALRSPPGAAAEWEARLFAARYFLDLFSNFTYFLADSTNGDGIEQVDDRWLGGVHARYGRPSGAKGGWAVGAGARIDMVDAILARQRERTRLGVRTDDRIGQGHGFAWVRYEAQLGARVRLELGMRGDAFRFDVRDRLVAGQPQSARRAVRNGVVSPKASLALDLTRAITLFANAAGGFHSNHARDVVLATGEQRVLPRAVGAELGARHTWAGGSVAASLWALGMQSELVYVGDEGVTEPSGRTLRRGVDLEGRTRLHGWLWADADLTFSHGRLRDAPAGVDRIPLAPRVTATAGLTARGASGWSGGTRLRHVGSRAADEAGSLTARGHTVAELFTRFASTRGVEWILAVDNLFDVEWNEAQFAATSRLPGEPEDGTTELHYTPGAPRSVQVGLAYRFR